jgi:hypothetical protein
MREKCNYPKIINILSVLGFVFVLANPNVKTLVIWVVTGSS